MLKELRQNAGLTQKELARLVGLREASISHYENGKRQPPLNKIKALAAALNVSELDIIKCFCESYKTTDAAFAALEK